MVLDKMNNLKKEADARAARLHDAIDKLTPRFDAWEKKMGEHNQKLDDLTKAIQSLEKTIKEQK